MSLYRTKSAKTQGAPRPRSRRDAAPLAPMALFLKGECFGPDFHHRRDRLHRPAYLRRMILGFDVALNGAGVMRDEGAPLPPQ